MEATFSATHRLPTREGEPEPLHGHAWRVRASWASPSLDDAGVVVDFMPARALLEQVVQEMDHRCLNELPAFAGRVPSAERVARYIFERLSARRVGSARLRRVQVIEAPGCAAAYTETPDGPVG